MKITVGIIVFNGDFFLKQVLESVYPWAHAICIAEGPVNYFVQRGIKKSTDETMDIILNFLDPHKKIRRVHGSYTEKDDQCRAWFRKVPDDTDYVFCVDADEIHSGYPIDTLIRFLEKHNPTSVGFKSASFYGGFDRILGGFERDHSFKRILKYVKGCEYRTHRQPTLSLNGNDIAGKDILGNQLYDETGIEMWHGSYVSPKGVYEKIQYYENAVISKGNCIPNYFKEVYLPWVTGNDLVKQEIENKHGGVHEFLYPNARQECRTMPFTGQHPEVILKAMPELQDKFMKQLKIYKEL
jgi:hypothetical protein